MSRWVLVMAVETEPGVEAVVRATYDTEAELVGGAKAASELVRAGALVRCEAWDWLRRVMVAAAG